MKKIPELVFIFLLILSIWILGSSRTCESCHRIQEGNVSILPPPSPEPVPEPEAPQEREPVKVERPPKIQENITVLSGVFRKNLVMDRPAKIVGKNAKIIPQDPFLPAIMITSPGVEIYNLSLEFENVSGTEKPGAPGLLGIYVRTRGPVVISGITINGFPTGIIINFSSDITLSGISVNGTEWNGLFVLHSEKIKVSDSGFTGSAKASGVVLIDTNDSVFSATISSGNPGYGFYLERSYRNTFSGGSASKNGFGFFLVSSPENLIKDFTVFGNRAENIRLEESNHTVVLNSVLYGSKEENGIYLNESHHTVLSGLKIYGNRWNGIYVNSSTNVTIRSCKLFGNTPSGAYIYLSSDITLEGVESFENGWRGIFAERSSGIDITDSIIRNNPEGIYLGFVSSSSVTASKIESNSFYGVRVENSSGVVIHDNIIKNTTGNQWSTGIMFSGVSSSRVYRNDFLNNSRNALDDGANPWDSGSEGNYWDDFDTPEEGCSDTDGNGICDSPYPSVRDSFPLTSRIASVNSR
ncbi:MAG: hypothetical protein GXO63_00950 [Candidatus Micrarchaeota archaeon]|nr:hypothetical protein [Candidatus Micrarchaeota archaeon]